MLKSKIKSMLSSFSKREMLIVDYINDIQQDPKSLTSSMLAKELGVSQSTIIRFTQKIGYPGFREFVVDLNRHYANHDVIDEESNFNDTTDGISQRLLNQYCDVIGITRIDNPPVVIERVVYHIQKARKIVLLGMGDSALFCSYFSHLLTKFGFTAFHEFDAHSAMVHISKLTPEDVLILVSETGETREIVQAASMAKTCDCPIVAITGAGKNTLRSYADVIVNTVMFQTETRMKLMTVRVSQLFIVDLIMINVFKSNYKVYNTNIQESDGIIRKYLLDSK